MMEVKGGVVDRARTDSIRTLILTSPSLHTAIHTLFVGSERVRGRECGGADIAHIFVISWSSFRASWSCHIGSFAGYIERYDQMRCFR